MSKKSKKADEFEDFDEDDYVDTKKSKGGPPKQQGRDKNETQPSDEGGAQVAEGEQKPPARRPSLYPGKYEDLNQEAKTKKEALVVLKHSTYALNALKQRELLSSFAKLPWISSYSFVTNALDCLQMSELFDGFRADLSRGISETFSVSHAFSLGSTMEPPSYYFGSTFVHLWAGTQNPMFIAMGRVNTDGQLMGRFHFNLKNFSTQLGFNMTSEAHQSRVHVEADYRGFDFHAQLKWMNPGSYGFSYFQKLNQKLSLGCDIFYDYKQGLAVTTMGGRYHADRDILAAVLTYGHLTASYTRQVSPKINLNTEIVFQQAQGGMESVFTVGAEYNLRMNNVRTAINTQGKVSVIFSELLNPVLRFVACAELDHVKKQYRFGLKLEGNT